MTRIIYLIIIIIPIILAFFFSCEDPDDPEPTPVPTATPVSTPQITPEPTPGKDLLPPENVNAELSGEEIHVVWESAESGCVYEVSRKTGEGESSVISIVPVEDMFFTDTNFPDDCTLQYTVRCIKGDRCSPPSNPSNAVSRFILGLKASRLEYTDRIVITWTPYEGATGYVVYRYDSASSDPEIIGRPLECEFIDTRAEMNTPYFYRVSWIQNNTEKGTGGPMCLGIYSDQKDFYEPNNDYKDIELQPGTSVCNPVQPPLIYSFGNAEGETYTDTDWYKYAGNPVPVLVTINLPEASLFDDGELEFSFFYNNVPGPSLPVNRGKNQYLFDNFGTVQGNVSLYFRIFPALASNRRVMGTYSFDIKNGLRQRGKTTD